MQGVGEGIVVTSYYVMGGEKPTAVEPVSERTPVFRNIAISHVTISGAKKRAINIDGLPPSVRALTCYVDSWFPSSA